MIASGTGLDNSPSTTVSSTGTARKSATGVASPVPGKSILGRSGFPAFHFTRTGKLPLCAANSGAYMQRISAIPV
jgi:hypothetical protein